MSTPGSAPTRITWHDHPITRRRGSELRAPPKASPPTKRCSVLRGSSNRQMRSSQGLTVGASRRAPEAGGTPVSYTHLTLPTILLV
eukprot:981474-Pyramimonas_sp.AAC.1